MKKFVTALLIIILTASSVLLSSRSRKIKYLSFREYVFGIGDQLIPLEATLYGINIKYLRNARDEILDVLGDLNAELNTADNESVITKFNNYGSDGQDFNPNEKFYVSKHAYHMLKYAKELHENENGLLNIDGEEINAYELFNPAIYPLMELWELDAKNYDENELEEDKERKIPTSAEIQEALKYIDYSKVQIGEDEKGYYITKDDRNIKIDLGGQAKGYAADLAVDICKKYYLKGAIINIGGNVYVYKTKPLAGGGAQKFTVGLKMPVTSEHKYFCAILAEDTSLVTSGDYVRYFTYDIKDGNETRTIKYAHILSPFTGLPVNIKRTGEDASSDTFDNTGLTSVTIINKSSELADICATIVMLLGMENGIKFMEKNGLTGVLISHDKKYAAVGNVEITEHKLGYEDYQPYELDGKVYGFNK
ncbi:MAG TPA: FAD:protein FMN transferase [Clostridia bacterium]